MNSVLSAPVFPAVINTEFLSWCCVRSPPRQQSRGLFLVSWPWSWTSALFTCWLQTKMVLTEGRKFGVRGRAGNSKPKESWGLQGSDLFLVTPRVTVLVHCGKMSDSSPLSSLSFSVYAAWVSRSLDLFWTVYVRLRIQTGRKNLFKSWGHHTLHPPGPSKKHAWAGLDSDLWPLREQ